MNTLDAKQTTKGLTMSICMPNPEATYTQQQIDEMKSEIALSEKEYNEEKDPAMKRRKLARVRNLKSVLRQMLRGKGRWHIRW